MKWVVIGMLLLIAVISFIPTLRVGFLRSPIKLAFRFLLCDRKPRKHRRGRLVVKPDLWNDGRYAAVHLPDILVWADS